MLITRECCCCLFDGCMARGKLENTRIWRFWRTVWWCLFEKGAHSPWVVGLRRKLQVIERKKNWTYLIDVLKKRSDGAFTHTHWRITRIDITEWTRGKHRTSFTSAKSIARVSKHVYFIFVSVFKEDILSRPSLNLDTLCISAQR